MNSTIAASGAVAAACIAAVLFLIGLLSPLTPSHGMPRIAELIAFVGIPLLLCVAGSWAAPSRVPRLACITAGAVIAGVVAWLNAAVY